jgi:7-carboxy-7-deazaguanine synthase (Cx14CxxC type)
LAYAVKEIFKTLQGEGRHAGRAAVFCRFAGCNLWSGRERDRAAATCTFCDTEFVGTDGPGGGKFGNADALADAVAEAWGDVAENRYVVLTGGEPMLQVDEACTAALHDRGFEIGLESNGTIAASPGIDWLCVSPKARSEIVQMSGDELKLVYPQQGLGPVEVEHMGFDHFWLQPMDGPHLRANTAAAVAYCLEHPRWKLSIQSHKLIGIP